MKRSDLLRALPATIFGAAFVLMTFITDWHHLPVSSVPVWYWVLLVGFFSSVVVAMVGIKAKAKTPPERSTTLIMTGLGLLNVVYVLLRQDWQYWTGTSIMMLTVGILYLALGARNLVRLSRLSRTTNG